MVRVGVAELEVEASLHVAEGGAGVSESGQDVVGGGAAAAARSDPPPPSPIWACPPHAA
jgi:hypothetical protein